MVKEILLCKDLTKSYNKEIALANASFTVFKNDIIFICGHNGSGKSTLIKIISGTLRPDKGYIGFNCSDNGLIDWKKYSFDKHIWVPQSVDEALAPNVRIDELASITDKENLIKIASEIRLKWLIETITNRNKFKLIRELSGGQKQLLVGLIALSQSKPIILLDEVFRALDNHLSSFYWEAVINNIEKTSGCALIVTHDLKMAKEKATRLLILKNGLIKHDIHPSEIAIEDLAIEVANID
jgi:ABC-type multidrug transport system ATPase subunit